MQLVTSLPVVGWLELDDLQSPFLPKVFYDSKVVSSGVLLQAVCEALHIQIWLKIVLKAMDFSVWCCRIRLYECQILIVFPLFQSATFNFQEIVQVIYFTVQFQGADGLHNSGQAVGFSSKLSLQKGARQDQSGKHWPSVKSNVKLNTAVHSGSPPMSV